LKKQLEKSFSNSYERNKKNSFLVSGPMFFNKLSLIREGMKTEKILSMAVCAMMVAFTLCGCKGNGEKADDGDSAVEASVPPSVEDFRNCSALIEVAKDKELSESQLNVLVDDFVPVLNYCVARVEKISAMPKGQEKCDAMVAFNNSTEYAVYAGLYSVLDNANMQSGFTNAVGQRVSAMDKATKASREKLRTLTIKIYEDCK